MRMFPVSVAGAVVAMMTVAACGGSDDNKTTSQTSSAPNCTSSGKNAFETYGADAFVAVNEQIFTNVGNEISAHSTTNLGDSFTKVGSGNPPSTSDDAATFKGNLAAFLVKAYGGPSTIVYTDGNTYSGDQDMVEAHTGLAITSSQYDYFVTSIVVPALTNKGVTADDVSSCFAPVITSAAFKASVVGH